jgi:hypothetical protein
MTDENTQLASEKILRKKASDYANEAKARYYEGPTTNLTIPSVDYSWIWLAHCAAYMAGYKAKSAETNIPSKVDEFRGECHG